MLRSRIGLGLVLACLVFSLTACGGGDDESMTPPMPDSGGGDEPTTPPTPTTQTCLDGSTVSANQACPTPTEEAVHRAIGAAQPAALDRAASALPTFGSVSQGSNVQDGITTDSVSISYIPYVDTYNGDTFHPVATIRTGDGTVLRSNDDPTRMDVELPSGRVVQVDLASDDWYATLTAHYTLEDWRIAEEETFKMYGEEFFVQQYGSYPIGDEVPYDAESRPLGDYTVWDDQLIFEPRGRLGTSVSDFDFSNGGLTAGEYLQHPRDNRAIHEVGTYDILDDSTEGPGLYTALVVHGFTDYPSATAAGDDDHLSWGSWLYYTITPSGLDVGSGAFADGVETPGSDVPITGTASYSGYTNGVAVKGDRSNVIDILDDDEYWDFTFLGQVTLQVDFATASVQGGVTNFQAWNLESGLSRLDGEVLGEDGFLKNLAIDLGDADIASGTFTGDARATSGLAGAAGKWGGQFFGTPDAGEAPPATGGTWGVTQGTGTDDWKMLGGFGAWKP